MQLQLSHGCIGARQTQRGESGKGYCIIRRGCPRSTAGIPSEAEWRRSHAVRI